MMAKNIVPPEDREDPELQFPPADEPETESVPDPAPDPFDLESLRLGQDFASALGVTKVLTVVRCRKPNRQEFIRTHPGEDWRFLTAAFEDKISRETYLVDRGLWSDLQGEIAPICLYLAISRQGDPFLWPIKLPGTDGRSNSWNDSAIAAAQLAERKWIRLAANMQAGLYDVFEASGDLSDPEWPELPFQEILRLCFRDRYVRGIDHPVLKQLRGEV